MSPETPGSSTAPYRKEHDCWLVELKLDQIEQLYNTLDPSPFWKRDLDPDAADYILDSVDELPSDAKVRLVIYADVADLSGAKQLAESTIRDYFTYRAHVNRLRLKRELERGRASLLVGLVFLAGCLAISEALSPLSGFWGNILREGFIIMGWVAMWRPLEIFLYDWWPHLARARQHERISHLPVDVRNLRRTSLAEAPA